MEITIAVLVSVVISLGICIYFQSMNKNNNAMEKVRKYADRRQEDLLKLSNEIQKKFDRIVADFASQQDQANVAIKLFKQQNSEFDDKIKSLEGNITTINTIQAKVDGFTKILGDLNNMTKQVEENLERIHKESGIVDNLKIRLNKQSATVDTIEKKIPEISKSFSAQNQEHLKAIGVKLLDEYENYATKLAAEIGKAKQDAEAALQSINQSIQSAYNEATTKAETLENTAFEHLSQNAEQRSNEYQKQLLDQTKVLENALNTKFNDVSEKSTAIFNDKIKALQEKYLKQLDALNGKNDSAYNSITEKFKTDFAKFQESYNSAFENATALNTKKVNEFNKLFVEQHKSLQEEINNVISSLHDETEEKVAAFASEYTERFESLTNNNNDKINEISDYYTSEFAKLNNSINALCDDTETKFRNFTSEYESKLDNFSQECAEQFSGETSSNTEKLNELKDFYVSEFQKVSDYVAGLNDNAKATLSEFEANYKQKIEEVSTSNNSKISSLKDFYTGQYDSVNAYIAKLNEETENKLNAMKAEYSQTFTDASNENNENIAKLNDICKAEFTKLNDRIVELDGIEAESKAKVDELKKGIDESLNQFTTRSTLLQTNIETMQNNLEDTIARVSSEANTAIQNAEKSVQAIEEKCSTAINKTDAIQPELDSKITEVQDAFEEFRKTIYGQLETYQGEIDTKLGGYKQDFTGKVGNSQEELLAKLEDSKNDIKSRFAQFQTEVTTRLSDFQTDVGGKYDNYTVDVNGKMNNFQLDVNSKIETLSKFISDSIKKAVSESEGKHLSILEDVDSELNSYKKDIEYKLSQIQVSETDIDTLEKSLRAAMNEVQNRLLGDFENFKTNQKQKHDEFNQTIQNDSDIIEQKISKINESIDDLQTTATGNMSNKLNEFETKFNQLLETKNNEFDTELAEWKHGIDTKVSDFTNTYEDQRKKIEAEYLANLKSNVSALSDKAQDQYSTLNSSIEQNQSNMEATIADLNNAINKLRTDTNVSINDISKNSEEEIKKEIEKNVILVNNSLSRTQEDLIKDLQSFEESIATKQESGSSNIDAALAEFNNWKQQFKQQLDSSTELFKDQLSSFENQSHGKMKDVIQKISSDMTTYADSVKQQYVNLNDKITSLENKTDSSIEAYEKRSNEILGELNNMYEEMLKATEQKVRTQNEDASAKMETLRSDIQKMSDESKSTQAKLVLKMQDEANGLQSQFSELTKELSDIKANISLYDKAEKMKRELDEKLEGLEKSFNKIQGFTDTADMLTDEYNNILNINNDIQSQLTAFESQKNRVLTLEQQYNKMIELSKTIDDRIQSLKTTSDDLQQMEVSVRNYNDKLQYVSEQYDRLNKKDSTVSRIITDVDTQFEKLKELEQKLINCNRQAVSLPQEIKEVQNNVDKLLVNGPKITEAIGRLENLDSLLEDTEHRIDALNSVQSGIKKTELDLQGLSREVDSKFKVLQTITQQNIADKPNAKASNSINPRVNESVRTLKRKGWSISEIANNLHLTENEVDLILQLPE